MELVELAADHLDETANDKRFRGIVIVRTHVPERFE
jgi:hypothetical protein